MPKGIYRSAAARLARVEHMRQVGGNQEHIEAKRMNLAGRVFATLTDEWQTAQQIATEVRTNNMAVYSVLETLTKAGKIEWKPFPKSSYPRKLALT